MPDVNYIDTTGKAYTPASLTGKVVVVNFWATFCQPWYANAKPATRRRMSNATSVLRE